MNKVRCLLAFSALLFTGAVYAAPLPDIKANASDAPQSLVAGSALRITLSLQSGPDSGTPADWWAVAYSASTGWTYFNLGGGWLPGLLGTYQGLLFDLPSIAVLETTGLPPGTYHFYFGVDTVMNGQLDMDSIYYDSVSVSITPGGSGLRLQVSDFTYLGAFRLPGGESPPLTFAYGGNAMTFNPDGDPGNSDAYPGSLFVMGHDRLAYGDLPDGNQVAEVSIPPPAITADVSQLPKADFIQDFQTVAAGWFTDLEEIPRVGMAYLNHPATGPKIHLSWGQHMQSQNEPSLQAWFDPTLTDPHFQGTWVIGDQTLYNVSGYMFEIPTSWAETYAQGRYLGAGRMRDGGWYGMGPALFAYRPWLPDGSAPPSGTHLQATPLLMYENTYNSADIVRCMNGYQHPDEWEGAAWITTTSGKTAVLFAGTKSTGDKYWYGYMNPLGATYPCVDTHIDDFTTCRTANGDSCPEEDFTGCCDPDQGTCITYRGWWSSRFDAQIILYDPSDLARVATGDMESWQPQPYASLDIDDHLYLDPPEWDVVNVGRGDQRRFRISAVTYDRAHDLLYVLEQLADGAKPVVHVWRLS